MDKRLVFVIGGPGKSGSTTLAKMLAQHFKIERVYGGQFFREEAERRGYSSLNEFLKKMPTKDLEEFDKFVDDKLRVSARTSSVVIESKIFAALATKENIPCTFKIWVDADIDVRVQRAIDKEGVNNSIYKVAKSHVIKKQLLTRYELDKQRYKRLYGIDYDQPEKYNDFVIDNSKQTPEETFNLIIKNFKDAGFNTEYRS